MPWINARRIAAKVSCFGSRRGFAMKKLTRKHMRLSYSSVDLHPTMARICFCVWPNKTIVGLGLYHLFKDGETLPVR